MAHGLARRTLWLEGEVMSLDNCFYGFAGLAIGFACGLIAMDWAWSRIFKGMK